MDNYSTANSRSTPFPLSSNLAPNIKEIDTFRIEKIVEKIKSQTPKISTFDKFGPNVRQGYKPGPVLYYEDHRSIALSTNRASNHYQYRFLLLARENDILLIEKKRTKEYEKYCRETLDLPSPDIICLKGKETFSPLAKRCIDSPKSMKKLVDVAKINGCLNIMPYINTGWTWVLGQRIAELANVTVYIMAPPPWLTQKANDKLWFSERLVECLGVSSLPRTYYAFGPTALAGKILRLAKKHTKVVVKIPSSASSMGNIVIDTSHVKTMTISDLKKYILSHIHFSGSYNIYPLAVSVWDSDVLTSPSLQVWIPLQEEGRPIVEGLFEQALDPITHSFIGARPAQLETELKERLIYEVSVIASLFQKLGYYGRCSIDAVVTNRKVKQEIHWIDCNARWGGVSIPMTISQKLTGNWRKFLKFIIQSNTHQSTYPKKDFINATNHLRFDPKGENKGIVIMNPPQYESLTYHDYMILAKNSESSNLIFRDVDRISKHLLKKWEKLVQFGS